MSQWWNMLENRFVVCFQQIVEKIFSFVAYGARCNCSKDHSGDSCQYKKTELRAKSSDDLPHVEYRQFDAETLAVIANLGSPSDENTQRMNGLSNSLTIATGNHSQFVFCLTNPCENGGTCFVTNTATTKVRFEENLNRRFSMD